MATSHEVKTIMRPGVQNIYVYYRYSSEALNWVTYLGGKLPPGTEIKFSVETYTDFTLTSWEAYYSDEYDDTVNISLSPITGESSWTFTMPNAEVYIRCEATGAGAITYPVWRQNDRVTIVARNTSTIASRLEVLSEKTGHDMLTAFNRLAYYYPALNNINENSNCILGSYQDSVPVWGLSVYTSGYSNTIPFTDTILNSNYIYPPYYNIFYNQDNSELRHEYGARFGPGLGLVADCTYRTGTYVAYYISHLITDGITTGDKGSIRYIMSPEDSGEVDASAPSEFEEGTTEFTFKWRIKAAYEFKRLTPFAIGDGSLEDDVVYSMQYDGETRTYTFTVSSIPEWAKGVRVLIETVMVDDPSSDIGYNDSDGPIGGNGTYDDSSDEVPLPAIPVGVSAPDTGFVTLFRPTITQIKDLSNYMWSNLTEFIENLQKIFTNPMDYVISLASFPVTPDVGPDRNIYVGNFLTNIQMPPITNQFYEFNCGTVNISEYFGSFLDYAPNTRARIMLPFIGDADLAINEIMGKTLRLWYRIDLLSGACVAVLTIDNSVYYQWTGNCSIQIPVTASDFSRLYAGIARVGITAAAVAAGGAYLGGLASAASGWNATNAGWHSVGGDFGQGYSPSPNFGATALPPFYGKLSTDVSADRGPQLNMSDYLSYTPPIQIPSKKSRALAAAAGGSFVGHNIMNAIPRVQHAGGMSGNIGIMGNRTPFIVLEYPNVSMPENYKHVFGYPSNMYKVLGSLAGYTKCKQVLFESTKTTDDEYEMVIEALKGGVYL